MILNLDFLDNDYVAAGIALFITLYALNMGRMKLPPIIKNLFSNNIFRVLFLSLLLIFNFDKAPHVAFGIALIFVLTLDYLDKEDMEEPMMEY